MVDRSCTLSHVALLVPSVEKAAVRFASLGFSVQPPSVFEGEGTKEIYVGDYNLNSALPLLVEPVKAGSYQKALEKRGAGIHHIAVDVLNIPKFIEGVEGTGWFLHINSLRTLREMKTVYLARPGMPTMIEVQEVPSFLTTPPLIQSLSLDLDIKQISMMQALGLQQIEAAAETALTVKGHKIHLKELI